MATPDEIETRSIESQLEEAKRQAMVWRIAYLRALETTSKAMYQRRWKGWDQ